MQNPETGQIEARKGEVVSFPLSRQVGRIRAAAAVLIAIDEIDVADNCRHAIAVDLFRELEAMGYDEMRQDEEVGAFFSEVELEMLRLEWAPEIEAENGAGAREG